MTPLEQFLVLYFSTASALAFFLTVYDKLAELDIDTDALAEKANSFWERLLEKIKEFLAKIFN